MITRRAFIAGLTLLACISASSPVLSFGESDPITNITGKIDRVVDGDTFIINGQRVRLWGIDAPETSTPLGRAIKEKIKRQWTGLRVTCTIKGQDRYRRIVAMCLYMNSEGDNKFDMAMTLVRNGLAKDWPQYSGGYYANAGP